MIGPHHVMTWGSTGEAAGGDAGGGAYYVRRKRWMAAFMLAVLILC